MQILSFELEGWVNEGVEIDRQDDNLLRRQRKLSDRANFALAVACVEWIVHRFHRLTGDEFEFPLEFLEAAWAGVIDTRYMHTWAPDYNEWSGPACSALFCAVIYAQQAAREASSQEGPGDALLYLSGLAQRVLPQPTQFFVWRNRTLDQLAIQFPFSHRDSIGDPVPRLALEQGSSFDMSSIEALTKSFVAALDFDQNDFLNTPENMQFLFFEGNPHQFDLKRDRACRNEW